MATGLLFRLFWIYFLLFNGSTGFPAKKDFRYPYEPDWRNLRDDDDAQDDLEDDLSSAPSELEASYSQPTGTAHMSYSNPASYSQPTGTAHMSYSNPASYSQPTGTAHMSYSNPASYSQPTGTAHMSYSNPASYSQPTGTAHMSYSNPASQQPAVVPNRKGFINKPSALLVERLVNGAPRDWRLNQLHKPITFPLSSNDQLGDQTRSTSLGVPPSYNIPVSPITGGSPHDDPPVNVKFPTFSQSPAANTNSQSGNSGSLQAEPVSSNSDSSFSSPYQNLNTPSSVEGSDARNRHHLVFEEVFQYPAPTEPSLGHVEASSGVRGYDDDDDQVSKASSPTYTSKPLTSSSATVGSTSSISGGAGHDSSQSGNVEQAGHRSQQAKTVSWFPQKPVTSPREVAVVQRVSQPIRRPPPPPSYIVQSRNGYMRRKFRVSKTSYSQLPPTPRPALTQPVASNGVKLT